MSGVFISYRREQTAGWALSLHERLSDRFGAQGVFMDVDAIRPGEDFVRTITERVTSCDVLIAIIGPTWLAAAAEDGSRRLDNADDFVRIEIASALEHDVYVIPVLVDDAEMPAAAELPAPLQELARRNAYTVSAAGFRRDADYLCESLAPLLSEAASRPAAMPAPAPSPPPAASAPPAPVPASARPAPARRGLGRLWSSRQFVIPAIALVALLIWTGVDRLSGDEPSDDGLIAAETPTAQRLSVETVTLDAAIEYLGTKIVLETATYDPERESLSAAMRVQNPSPGTINLFYLVEDWKLYAGETELAAYADFDLIDFAPGANSRVSITWALQTDDAIRLGDVTLIMGEPNTHQSRLRLDPEATPEFETAAPISLSGQVAAGTYVVFVVEQAFSAPFGCSSGGAWDRSLLKQEAAIIVAGRYESRGTHSGEFTQNLALRLPDGTTAAADPAANDAVYQGETVRNVQACFVVPATLTGEFVLTTVARLAGSPGPEDLSFSVP